jgi:starch synthase (maltosyl-transferring)
MRIEMKPAPGELLLRFTGDRIRFSLFTENPLPRAYLRTNLGRAPRLHAEVLQEYKEELALWDAPAIQGKQTNLPRGLAWRDIPMRRIGDGWQIDLALPEVGFFYAKAYAVDEQGRQVWPEGSNLGITVHPNEYRSGNTIYCAFTRMFGESKIAVSSSEAIEPLGSRLDKQGYSVIPPSGKLRDLVKVFPHIFDTLGCRILQLLPVNPVPTTYARFGRFGSPYACLDLTGIDPALVEFDRRTTGIDQFRELTYAAHCRGGKVLLDIVINHTGWGSNEQEKHPEWFLRNEQGVFVSPGAWGTTWEDLVEIDHRSPLPWDYLAEVFITWCRRGVDGFRCDAGYKIPTNAWRYIVAKVRHEFPNTLFLLEGLGGSWEATEDLLTRGGMQWAYSELFQNINPIQVNGYMDHSIQQSERAGTLIHFSETHDNDRLAKKGRTWSLMRNQLCALASHNGGFAFTCGVEWLATEKINVHGSSGLAWGNSENLLEPLQRLNRLLSEHPCFFDRAELKRLSSLDSPVYALKRTSADSRDTVLVLVNLDAEKTASFFLLKRLYNEIQEPAFDLLSGTKIKPRLLGENVEFSLKAGQSLCLAFAAVPKALTGEHYRKLRLQHSWAVSMLAHLLEPEEIGPHDWIELANFVEQNPREFLRCADVIHRDEASQDLMAALSGALTTENYRRVVEWTLADVKRVVPIPPDHWLLVQDKAPFRVTLTWGRQLQHVESIRMNGSNIAVFYSRDAFRKQRVGKARLTLERYCEETAHLEADLLFLDPEPVIEPELEMPLRPRGHGINAPVALLTNGLGGMARMCVDLGQVKSKYDCVLGANLHPSFPVDRHIFVKRVRVWANANGFITPLDGMNIQSFSAGPPAAWEFAAISGDGQVARIQMLVDMLPARNTTIIKFTLISEPSTKNSDVSLTVRFDVEDRNFHTETHHNGGAEFHFLSNISPLPDKKGFLFRPASDRQLRISASTGKYIPSPEWSNGLPHDVERSRGQPGFGDAYSPGWFDLPLSETQSAFILVTAEREDSSQNEAMLFEESRLALNEKAISQSEFSDSFGKQLAVATQAYIARRDEFKTIIAGYPWFLDWGRDSLICARGLVAAGLENELRQILIAFGRFEKDGTLPNTIHGADATNRDTSDAPLWFGMVCEEFATRYGDSIYDVNVDSNGRTIKDVLRSIGLGYSKGTSNGIQMDSDSDLIWSPSHFTWMDTNFPAGTPREGYPIEIQALWIRLLRQLDRIQAPSGSVEWNVLAARAKESFTKYFWLENKGWLADVLLAKRGVSATQASPDDALRSNCVIPLTLDLVPLDKARRCLEAVIRYLVIPGALRSLAPLAVSSPLSIHGPDWRLLNNPKEPYWPRYEGDEDTQRKPAYHNGTAWTWTFPGVCEAIARLWDFSPAATVTAKAYLGSMKQLIIEGCIGQIPEVLDGDAPHTARGCDAQAWGVTEALRVWKLLSGK